MIDTKEIREEFADISDDYYGHVAELCDEVDRLREALEHSYHCGLAISHGMGCPVAEAIGPKETT